MRVVVARSVAVATWLVVTGLAIGAAAAETAAVPKGPYRQVSAPLSTVVVADRTGPGGQPLRTTRRSERIDQYPCGLCHQQPLAVPADTSVSRRWAHLDIRLRHAAALACASCHAYADLDRLRLVGGGEVTFDHSYRVCAQCHFQQAADWAGGAHGKRLSGWRGERVVENCTGCHDPHAPAFPRRMPLLFPQVPRTGR